MVAGTVHNNGMLDPEQHFTRSGLPLRDAVFQAGRRRLRPIFMTALATIPGMLPRAIGVGSGMQLLQPVAIAVIPVGPCPATPGGLSAPGGRCVPWSAVMEDLTQALPPGMGPGQTAAGRWTG